MNSHVAELGLCSSNPCVHDQSPYATCRISPSVTTSPASYEALETFDGRRSRSSSDVRALWPCPSNPYWDNRSLPANPTRRDPPPQLLLPHLMHPKTPKALTEVALRANVLGGGLIPGISAGMIKHPNLRHTSQFHPPSATASCTSCETQHTHNTYMEVSDCSNKGSKDKTITHSLAARKDSVSVMGLLGPSYKRQSLTVWNDHSPRDQAIILRSRFQRNLSRYCIKGLTGGGRCT